MSALPYLGQGLSLPVESGIDGEWIEEGVTFLFRVDPPSKYPEFIGMKNGSGLDAHGFNADSMAELLETDALSLLLANQKRLLRVSVTSIPATHGGVRTFNVNFQLPFKGIDFDFNEAQFAGKA